MKNKKIIFTVAIICCLVVAFACFSAFAPSVSTSTSYKVYFNFGNVEVALSDLTFLYLARWNSSNAFAIPSSGFVATQFDTNTIVVDVARDSSLSREFYIYCFDSSNSAPIVINSAQLYNSSGSSITLSIFSYSSNYVKFSAYSSAQTSTSYNGYIVANCSFVGGGVSQEDYDNLLQRFEDLEEDYYDLEDDYDDLLLEIQELDVLYQQQLAINTALNAQLVEITNDRNAWQTYAQGLEEQYDELWESNALLQHNYDILLREYNIIVSENESIGFVARAFQAVGDILEIEILPQITIGTVVSIPLILGVVFLVLRLVRGE